jgi:TRAP-type C4-dicarboxylate transport system substrate-binding protein
MKLNAHPMKARIKFAMAVAIAAAAVCGVSTGASAQDKRTLKYSSVFPANNWTFVESLKVFQEEAVRLSGGKIQFENYYAGQISKEGVNALATGLADVAIMVPSYEPAKLPLTSVAELPGLHSSSCEGTAKFWSAVRDGGVLNNAEYKPLGVKVLYGVVLTPYQVFTNKKPVTSLKDLEGLKIRANGAAMDKTVRALGAIPIRVTATELYDALSRGTIDGAFWNAGATRNAGVEKVLKFAAMGPQLGGGTIVYGMRQQTWDALTAEEKTTLTAAATKAQQHVCSYLDRADVDEVAWLTKNLGFKAFEMSKEESARWNDRVKTIGMEWAKDMDSTGRPGSALLKAYQELPAR